MTNPNELTGRDLDRAVTEALGIDTPFPMGWNEARKIPELFAEIAMRSGVVELVRLSSGRFVAICRATVTESDLDAEGSTPSEALARLLLMVVGDGN